jgi:hypothetical protein
MNKSLLLAGLILATSVSGCASGPEAPAYPAFVVSQELPDLFLATLPGVRAKEYAGDLQTRSVSNRIEFPEGWSGTTGGAPGKALELFVLAGELKLSDFALTKGGYAYIPPGSMGFNMHTDEGAVVLYFLGDLNGDSQIRSPLLLDTNLVDWRPTDSVGVFARELRSDPGSGERTWLMRYEPGAQIPWQASSTQREGYLVAGQFQDSECVGGRPYTGIYFPGGYFRRPAEAVHGGPDVAVISESIWFLREHRQSTIDYDVDCVAP